MYYIYILRSKNHKNLYRGITTDLKDRLKRHNSGQVLSTKAYLPWELIYYESFLNKKDAKREELFLKSGKGRERIKFLLKNTLTQ